MLKYVPKVVYYTKKKPLNTVQIPWGEFRNKIRGRRAKWCVLIGNVQKNLLNRLYVATIILYALWLLYATMGLSGHYSSVFVHYKGTCV